MHTKEIWLFIFIAGALAFNWPFLAVFSGHLPLYLFLSWVALITAIRIVVGETSKDGNGE